MRKILATWQSFIDKHFPLYLAMVLGLFAYGGWVAWNSEVEAFPDVTNVQVQVITQFPGKAAEEVERQVTIPLEMATNGLPGLLNRRSISMFGLSVITLTFDDNVQSKEARLNVSMRLQDLDIPKGASPALSPDSTPVGEIYRYVLEGNAPTDELRLIQDWTVMREIKGVPGVADVVVFGGERRSIDVVVDQEKLKEFNIDFNDVVDELSDNNMNAGGGFIDRGDQGFLVRSLGLFEKPETLANAVIASRESTPVRVSDVGSVKLGVKPRLGQVGFADRDDVVEGIVLLRKGADTLGTCARIRERVDYLNREVLPKGIQVRVVNDRTELIERSSHTVRHNIIFGIVLVVSLLLIGLGHRFWPLVLAVLMVIPFALFCAFIGVRLAGFSPNLISLGAVDFGIIVETAIFCVEAVIAAMVAAVATHQTREAIDQRRLTLEALAKVMGPALLCAGLLLIAFIPILGLQRVEGRIFRPLGITLVAAVVGGQLGAFLFVPLAARFTRLPHDAHSWQEAWWEKSAVWLRQKTQFLVSVPSLKHWVVGVLGVCIMLLYVALGKEFLPNFNEGTIYIRVSAPASISLTKATELAAEVRRRVKTLPEVRDVVSQIGRPDDGTDVNGFDTTEFFVPLIHPDEWKTASTVNGLVLELQKRLASLPGVEISFSQPIKDNVDEAISGVKGELVVKIFGPKSEELRRLADQVANIVRAEPGSQDVAVERLFGQPELRFTMDHDRLGGYGLTVADAAGTLERSLVGIPSTRMMDQAGRFIDVVVKPSLPSTLTTSSLGNLSVRTGMGAKVYLRDVTKTAPAEGIIKIYREEGERRVAVKISVRGRAIVDFVKVVDKKIREQVQLPPYYRMVWAGSFENASRAGKQLMVVVPICLAVIVIILQTWFGSWGLAGLALLELPFGVIGSLIGLFLWRLNLSISAAAGVVVLLGISLLTGMMFLTDWIETRDAFLTLKRKGLSIVLSNGVAIIGLVPAAFSNGIGAETAKPFAVAILCGLVSSLVLTLVLLPRILERESPR